MDIILLSKRFFYRIFPFLERYQHVRQFIKFCIVGATNVTVDLFVYIMATRFFLVYFVYANIISFIAAVSWSFFWNRRWTFRYKVAETLKEQYVKFFVINITGAAVQTTLLYIFVEKFSFPDLYVKFSVMVFVAFWNFFMTKFWVFRI